MSLQTTGVIKYDDIRKELGLGIGNFSTGQAESGTYVAINPCSTYKPSGSPDCSLSEWYGYDHLQACVAYEFPVVSCDSNVGICDQPFNTSQANQNLSMTVYTGISLDGDSLNNVWEITNASRYPSAYFLVFKSLNGGVRADPVYEFTGTYTPWNGVANRGTGAGSTVSTGTYYYYIEYNDGTGRTLTGYLFIYAPTLNEMWTSVFAYSASSSAGACSASNWANFAYEYPLRVGRYMWLDNGNQGSMTGTVVPAGYYRRKNTNNWYQINSSGQITATGTC